MATNNIAYNNFIKNISSVDDLLMVYENIVQKSPELREQANEILRGTIVVSVSALDNFLHDFYRTEIIESYLGAGNFQVKFENLRISINCMKQIDTNVSIEMKRNILTTELRTIQRTDSYQSPKSIEYLFTNLGVKNIWTQLQLKENDLKPDEIKREIANIIDRRNKISHEADWDFINNQKYPIELEDAKTTLLFVKSLVESINKL